MFLCLVQTVTKEESSLVSGGAQIPDSPVERQTSESQDEHAEADDDENKLESAESSAVSLIDSIGGQDRTHTDQGKALPILVRGLSSGDGNPSSPFFIPKNPLLDLVGKVPKFKWTSFHVDLLEDLFLSLYELLEKSKK